VVNPGQALTLEAEGAMFLLLSVLYAIGSSSSSSDG